MRCCVPFCVNNSEILPDPQNVTFHRLPTEATRHAAWLEALGIQKEQETHKVLFVCSLHFKESDFYTTKGGQRAVQRSGLPKTEHVCIICLDTGRKLFSLSYFNLDGAYEKITGISLKTFKIILSPKVCSECGQRLINFDAFRDKSIRANRLLLELSRTDELLRIQNIKSINRKKHKLKSNLTKIIFKPNYYDFSLVWNEDRNLNNVKLENKKSIKTENRENKEKNIKIENIVYGSTEVKNESSKVTVVLAPKDESLNDIASDEEFLHDDIDNDNFLNGGLEKVIKNNGVTTDTANMNDFYKTVKLFKQGLEIDVEFASDDVTNFDTNYPLDSDRNVTLPNEIINNDIYPLNDDINIDFPDDNDVGLDCTSDNGSDIEFVDQAPVKVRKKSVKSVKKSGNKDDMEATMPVKSRKRNKPLQGRYLKRKTPTGDMELFKVSVLTYEEQVADIQCKKDTPLYKNSTYKCTYCFKGYQYEDAYESHMEQHTDKYGVFECAICGIHTKSRQKLLHHLNMTHIVRYTCTKCPFFTRHRNTAKSHARWHNGIKSKCKYCDVEFSKMTSLLSHLRKKHPSDQVCTLCGYSFIGERGLALHMQKKHQFDDLQMKPAGPACAACGIRFASDAAYEQHVRVSPKHAPPEALEPNEPRWHKPKGPPRRKGDQTVTCEQCGMTLKGFKHYTYHFKRHHRDKIRTQFANAHERCLCELCGRVLQHSSALKSHMLVHTGKKDIQCPVCDKRFYHQRQLTIHMDTHNEAKRTFDCPVCARSFTSKSNKNRHLWTHTQVSRPFKCHACPKTFVYPSERKIHVNHAHANQPYPKKNKSRVRSSRPRHSREAAYAQLAPHHAAELCADASYGSEATG